MLESDFKNKVYLVTGANGRIGYALSQQLISLGAKVIMTDKNISKIQNLNLNNNHLIKKIDIIKAKNIKKIISQSNKKFNKIDGVIHCAYPVSKIGGHQLIKLNLKV